MNDTIIEEFLKLLPFNANDVHIIKELAPNYTESKWLDLEDLLEKFLIYINDTSKNNSR